MHIRNRFEVPMPPARAWAFLMNLHSTVPCFPGAELVEQVDDENFRGRVTVKLGPVSMVFNGKIRIEGRDEAEHAATVKATWTESRGRGNAVTVTRFALRADGAGTAVDVETDVQLAGQVAQYGRGVGVISEISAQLISKFAENLRNAIEKDEAGADAGLEHDSRSEISGLGLLGRALLNRAKGSSK